MNQTYYVILDGTNLVVGRGHCPSDDLTLLSVPEGQRIVVVDPELEVAPRDSYDPATGAVTKAPPLVSLPVPTLSFQEARAIAYPSLGDLADALYWRERGNPNLYNAWLARCDAVKVAIPKPTA